MTNGRWSMPGILKSKMENSLLAHGYRFYGGITVFLMGMFAIHGKAQEKKNMVLTVKEIHFENEADLDEVSRQLEARTELQSISLVNWPAFPYRPDVKFRIAHSGTTIWLKFYVTEDHVLARRTETNSATHRDSCVEFFLDTQKDGNYYNFEFNAIGTTHLAYGPSVNKRTFIDPELIREHIKVRSSLGNLPFEERSGGHTWEMIVGIPAALLVHDKGIRLKGLRSNANFYKCGDETSVPHYLSWNPVGSERPNFHQPQYFGELIFE